MFLLSVQKNVYIILSLYVERHVHINSGMNFMSPVDFQASEIQCFFGKFNAELVWKLSSVINNSLKPRVLILQ